MTTNEQYIEMGKKAEARKQRDALLTAAHSKAVKRLIVTHQKDFDIFLNEAKLELGLK